MTRITKGFKGFDKDLKCRDMQYDVGKTYEIEEGKTLAVCPDGVEQAGLHACEFPLDVFSYYEPSNSRFCEVESDLPVKTDTKDSKFAASRLTIKNEISLKDLIDLSVKFILSKVEDTKGNTGNRSVATNTGYRSVATNTGYRSVATNTGDESAATNTGDRSAATNTGNRSVATNTGDRSVATNTGSESTATNTGYRSVAANTGDRSVATNTGDRSAATNTGDRSVATNTGDRSAATNTGKRSVATNTGDRSVATNTGDWSAATSTGDRNVATNTGDEGAAIVEGKESVAVALGIQGKAKGTKGCFLVLADWREADCSWSRVGVVSMVVDGEAIKEDTFYAILNGEVVEVQ